MTARSQGGNRLGSWAARKGFCDGIAKGVGGHPCSAWYRLALLHGNCLPERSRFDRAQTMIWGSC